jgi:hypothetical protein
MKIYFLLMKSKQRIDREEREYVGKHSTVHSVVVLYPELRIHPHPYSGLAV